MRARAFYRTTTRPGELHQPRYTHIVFEHPLGDLRGECGTNGVPTGVSSVIVLDPMPAMAPAGLAWCPRCIGQLAERMGAIGTVAASLASLQTIPQLVEQQEEVCPLQPSM